MDVAIWVLQGLLAFAFVMAGGMKLSQGKEKAMERMGEQAAWMNDFTDTQIRAIGLAEVLGAVGLVLPMALDVAPVLTPIAAVCLALLMAGAVYTHIRRKEVFIRSAILGGLALLIAIGRFFVEAVV